MAIDIILLILLVVAIIRGMRRGMIVAIFSVLACIIGLAAAIKLSAVVALLLKEDAHIHSKWLPLLAFMIVFVVAVILVRWFANILETAVDVAFLEWLNKLGGAVLYVALFLAVYSVVLFYGKQTHIISQRTIDSSTSYRYIAPWGPAMINGLGSVIPIFRDMFASLESFFSSLAHKAS
ncbi:MAG: colicin V production protein [Bacteroidetes bacterium]|nr:MAG: colicin V production protein [Bacteroidota bacterium]